MSKADSNIIVKSPIIRPEDLTMDRLRSLSSESFPMWCLTNNVVVDSNKFDFEKHRYLLPIYADNSDYIVVVKAAQLGLTIYTLLRLLHFLEANQGRKAAIYFPTREGADNLSQDRLHPIIQSCPSVASIYKEGSKLSLRKIGESSLYINHLGGSASKDSVPLDMLVFDEVRLCSLKDIDQARERISHSPYRKQIAVSTCGKPQDTIHKMFMAGNQLTFRVSCGCPDGADLARQWPDCVVERPEKGELYLRCTKCGHRLNDTQNGRYVPMNPGADYNSYHMCQLHSKYISLKEIWRAYKTTSNMAEFYNAKLGLPFIDEDNRGIAPEKLEALIDENMLWGFEDPKLKNSKTAMGVDVGADYAYVTIMDVDPSNSARKRIRHIEVIERRNKRYYDVEGNPQNCFVRIRELMKEFNVGLAVIDQAPNYDQVLDMAKDMPGKVYAANFSKGGKNVVEWGDRTYISEGVKKSGKYKNKYHVNINRFLGLQAMYAELNNVDIMFPNRNRLRQVMRNETTGVFEPTLTIERWFDMLPRHYKVWKVTNEDEGTGSWTWEYAGGDPHASFSLVYANVALERLRRQAIFTFA
jgi:Phage terminase large subunit (GpA)